LTCYSQNRFQLDTSLIIGRRGPLTEECAIVADYCGTWSRDPWRFTPAMAVLYAPLVAVDITTCIAGLTAAPDRSALNTDIKLTLNEPLEKVLIDFPKVS